MLTQPTFPEDIGSTLGWSLPPEGSTREIVELPSDPDTIAEVWKLFGFSGNVDAGSISIGSVMEGHDWLNSLYSIVKGNGEGGKTESRMYYNRGTKNTTLEEMHSILNAAPERIQQRAYIVDSLIEDVASFCRIVLGRTKDSSELTEEEEDLLDKLPSYQLLRNIMNTRGGVPLQIAIDSSKTYANQYKIRKLQGLLSLMDSMFQKTIQFSDNQKQDYSEYTEKIEKAIQGEAYDDLGIILNDIKKEMITIFQYLIEIGWIDPSMYIFNTSQSSNKVYHLHPNINNVTIRGYTCSLITQLDIPITN